jgi:hypothetical protein
MELYRSGLLNDLPGGIHAPASYDSLHLHDSVWVWLEDITDGRNGLQGFNDYAHIARRLGRFNGAWMTSRTLPAHPALSHFWLRQWVNAAGPSLERLAAVADHPLVRKVYPSPVLETWQRLWRAREVLCARLERLPQTFAHLDAFGRNTFVRYGGGIPDDVILIDWSFTGIASLGEELVPLVVASAIFMETPVETLDQLHALALDAYIDGLRDAGWRGDPGQVRDGFILASTLRYGLGVIRVVLKILLGEWPHAEIEQMLGRPFHEISDNMADVYAWVAGLARQHKELLA